MEKLLTGKVTCLFKKEREEKKKENEKGNERKKGRKRKKEKEKDGEEKQIEGEKGGRKRVGNGENMCVGLFFLFLSRERNCKINLA